MTEERTLVANLVPQIADEDLKKMLEEVSNGLSTVFTADVGVTPTGNPANPDPSGSNGGRTDSEVLDRIDKNTKKTEEHTEQTAKDLKEDAEGTSPKSNRLVTLFGGARSAITTAFADFKANPGGAMMAGLGAVMLIFDIMKGLWDRFVNASPFLSNILSMFNGLLNIILGPIGTAIGMELIPTLKATYERVMKGVQAIWSAYEEGGLKGMIEKTFDVLMDVFLPLIQDLWDVGSTILDQVIGAVLDKVFGEGTWETIKGAILQIAEWVGVIADFFHFTDRSELTDTERAVGYYTDPPIMRAVHMVQDLFSGDFPIPFLADGGIVDRPTLAVVGEREREWIVPQSKVSSFVHSQSSSTGGTVNYYVTFNGYNDDDIIDKMNSVIDKRTDMYRASGGF